MEIVRRNTQTQRYTQLRKTETKIRRSQNKAHARCKPFGAT